METPEMISSGYHSPIILSDGSFSRLYRISRSGKYFIIKVAKEETYKALIRREYDISIGISHPNVVNVFTYEENTSVGEGLVMEYVDGRTLREFLSESPSLQLRRRVVDQILSAVSYLHAQGVVHNDLKPENILITKLDNTVKLIDFGLSDNDAQYLYRTLGCSPQYASPELLAQNRPDSRSDIYSLGILIREILGRGRAFRITRRCTADNRERRYANVQQLQKALAHRSYPIYLTAATAALAAVIYFGRTTSQEIRDLREYKLVHDRVQMFCDSVYRVIDFQLDSLFSDVGVRMSEAVYNEFAWRELSKVNFNSLKNRFLNVTSDRELNTLVYTYYTKEFNRMYGEMVVVIEAMPSVENSDLSPQEYDFYKKLIRELKPYRPYKK